MAVEIYAGWWVDNDMYVKGETTWGGGEAKLADNVAIDDSGDEREAFLCLAEED
jgi:hypothetical protein